MKIKYLYHINIYIFYLECWLFSDCPSFTYGVECEKTCTCDQNKSLSCDKDTGECLCKDGWAGVRCTCRNKSDCDENSYYDGTSCVCNDGFLTKTSNCSGMVKFVVADILKRCLWYKVLVFESWI